MTDSVNFALALRRLDPAAYQPHPPGYFLYMSAWVIFNLVFHDANTALVAISIVFSCGAVAMIYLLAGMLSGTTAALVVGVIFSACRSRGFTGTVALTYRGSLFVLVDNELARAEQAGAALGTAPGGFRCRQFCSPAAPQPAALKGLPTAAAGFALLVTTMVGVHPDDPVLRVRR